MINLQKHIERSERKRTEEVPTYVDWDITDGDTPTLIYWSRCREHTWHMGEFWREPQTAQHEAKAHLLRWHGISASVPAPCTGDDSCKGSTHIEGCYSEVAA